MKPLLKYTLITLVVVLAAGISVAGVVYAQGNGPDRPGYLAELLGLTPEELHDHLREGNTIQELADAAGVDLEAYREEMHQSRLADLQIRIETALAAGDISQDQAAWLLEGLEKGYLDGPFVGMGGRNSGRPGSNGAFMRGLGSEKPAPSQ
jgi:hypothetical protein